MSRRINLHIEGLKKNGREIAQEADRDIVWPTMLEDDQPFLGSFVFKFFRGDTKWDPDLDEGKGGWVPIPEWTGPLTEKGRVKWSETSTGPFSHTVEDIDFVYVGNDFLLTASQLQAEYGSDASDPWKRMPLNVVTSRDEDYKRWAVFQGGLNIRLRLLVDSDVSKAKFDVSQDLLKDNTKKGCWRFVDRTDPEQSDEFRLSGLASPRRFGLEVHEVGTKSLCHYIHQSDPGRSELSYGIDWLEPEGIFICPFNTLDTDNYKVTKEPDYTADAVDGRILIPRAKTDVEVYFVFRRWAYHCRMAHIHKETIPGPKDYLFTTHVVGVGYVAGAESVGCTDTWDYSSDPCGHFQASCGINTTDHPAVVVDCSGTYSGEGVFREDYYGLACCPWNSNIVFGWQDGGCKIVASSGNDCPYTMYGLPDLWNGGWYPCPDCSVCWAACSRSMAYTWKITFPAYTRYYGNSYIGLWWGPPPVDFFLSGISERSGQAEFAYTLDPDTPQQTALFDLIGDESYDDAVEHLIQAGSTAEEAAAAILSGYNSLHYYAPSEWAKIRVQTPLWAPETGFDTRWIVNRFCSTADGKLFSPRYVANPNPPDQDAILYTGVDDQFANLWRSIDNSEFAKTYWKPNDGYEHEESGYCGRDPWMDVPYGVGLSPMRAGALCALVKIHNKVYYVWRTTDEEFTEQFASIAGTEFAKPFVSFEGPEAGPCYQFYVHFSGEGRRNTHILTPKQAVCTTASAYGLPRIPVTLNPYSTCEDSRVPFIVAGAAQVQLESPVYPIISRERAVPLTEYWRLMRDSVAFLGWGFVDAHRNRY